MADVPTLYQWLGGAEPLRALLERFYEKVPNDPLIAPLFATMSPGHVAHVTAFIAEVLGGPNQYSSEHGGHAEMVRHHLGKNIREEQRKRWVGLLLETADELNVPSDPEFRSALVAYLEWGSRLAVINSALAPGTEVPESRMPEWGWGVPGGPYQP